MKNKVKLTESIQSKSIEPACAEFPSNVVRNSAKLTIPRLELVARHMAANLVQNVKEVLKGFPIRSVYGWLDSTVALHWIRGNGEYKQFMGNRVRKIQEKEID